MAKNKKGEPTFAEALAATEEKITALEKGDLGLEDALAAYEQGVASLRTAQGILNRVENKIKSLSENADGTLELQDFATLNQPAAPAE